MSSSRSSEVSETLFAMMHCETSNYWGMTLIFKFFQQFRGRLWHIMQYICEYQIHPMLEKFKYFKDTSWI